RTSRRIAWRGPRSSWSTDVAALTGAGRACSDWPRHGPRRWGGDVDPHGGTGGSGLDLSPAEIVAIRLSLRVAFWARPGRLAVGILAGTVLARGRFWGKSLLDTLVHLPLILPPVVTGYFLLILFGRKGMLGAFLAETFGIVFAFRWTGAALASAVMGFPLMVRSIRLSVQALHRPLH